MDGTRRDTLRKGIQVAIVLKQDQRSGKRTIGIVKDILTKSATPTESKSAWKTAPSAVSKRFCLNRHTQPASWLTVYTDFQRHLRGGYKCAKIPDNSCIFQYL